MQIENDLLISYLLYESGNLMSSFKSLFIGTDTSLPGAFMYIEPHVPFLLGRDSVPCGDFGLFEKVIMSDSITQAGAPLEYSKT